MSNTGGGREATVTEVQAGSAATLVYDGSGQAAVKEFTATGLVEDSLYAFKVKQPTWVRRLPTHMKAKTTADVSSRRMKFSYSISRRFRVDEID